MNENPRSATAKLTVTRHQPLGFFTRDGQPLQLLTLAIESDHGHPCLLVYTDPEGRGGSDPYTAEAFDLDDMATALASHADGLPFRCKEGRRVCGRVVGIDVDRRTIEVVSEPDLDTRTW